MDTVVDFITIFERLWRERNYNRLIEHLNSGLSNLLHLSASDSDRILSILFDGNRGLLRFLKDELQATSSNKSSDNAICEALRFVEFIIEQFHSSFEPYIINTMEVCKIAIFRTNCNIMKKGSKVLKKLIQFCNSFEYGLTDIIKKIFEKRHTFKINERSELLSLFGPMAKYSPEIVSSYADKVYSWLSNDFSIQFKQDAEIQSKDIQTYLDVLTDMLGNISPYKDNPQKSTEFFEKLYNYIKHICSKGKGQIQRTAIKLLSNHMSSFGDHVFNDYKLWHEIITFNFIPEERIKEGIGFNAMKSLYKTIGNILQCKTFNEGINTIEYFKTHFSKCLTDDDSNSMMVFLSIYGFSQIAGLYEKFSIEDDVTEMYSLIENRAIFFYFREEDTTSDISDIFYYQEALSSILSHMPNITTTQMNTFTKLCVLSIKRFPDFDVIGQTLAKKSLSTTLSNVANLGGSRYREFLHNLIYKGIIWSCSRPLLIDAELEQDRRNLPERPICYKNYLPLWRHLLDLNPEVPLQTCEIVQQVSDEVLEAFISIINKLDLNTKLKDDNVFWDVALSQTAENGTDFRTFVNLVDLYVDIFKTCKPSLLEPRRYKFLFEVIRNSYKRPLISGFYKLVHGILMNQHEFYSSDEFDENSRCFELIHQYLSSVVDLVCNFSNELQITCLYLIFHAPLKIAQKIMDCTAPIFKIAFAAGLNNFPLVFTALDTLEKWSQYFDKVNTKEFFLEIMFSIEPYLQSRESVVELLQDILKTQRKVMRRITFVQHEITLEEFQRKILLFFGSLPSDMILSFVHRGSMNTGATWDSKNLLKYNLYFPDLKLDLCFDKVLIRLVNLALHAGDRHTKLAACEVLHSMVALLLGNTKGARSADQFESLYKMLYPVLLNLGCDTDDMIQLLYRPLFLQLTHWQSSTFMLKSQSTVHLVDSLFDGLCSESNTALRDFSGICLAEFVKWSIKQSTHPLENDPNILVVLPKITSYSLHPSTRKRVAAAVAFNHLYVILRESEEIVNLYWLEFLYCFVKNLDGCNDPRITAALNHVERVLKERTYIFDDNDPNRKIPTEFVDATLKSAVDWLFLQIGSLDRDCRKICMQLCVNISQHVDYYESPKIMIAEYIQCHGMQELNSLVVGDLHEQSSFVSYDEMRSFLRSLDCYVWLLRNDLIDSNVLFGEANSKKDVIFHSVKNFARTLLNGDTKDSPREREDLNKLRCKVVLTVFDFIQTILEAPENLQTYVPHYFWSDELFRVIFVCLLSPSLLGFDTKNLDIAEVLPMQLQEVLQSLIKNLEAQHLDKFKNMLSGRVIRDFMEYFDVEIVLATNVNVKIRQYVKGVLLLKKCHLLDVVLQNGPYMERLESVIRSVFNALREKRYGKDICAELTPDAKEYLGDLLELSLGKSSALNVIMELIINNKELHDHSATVSQGRYFLNVFKNQLLRFMLKEIRTTLEALDNFLRTNASCAIMIVEQLTTFALQYKKNFEESVDILTEGIIRRCTTIERVINSRPYCKATFVSIYGTVVRLMRNPLDVLNEKGDLYIWIVGQLNENSDLAHKTEILQNFLICLIGETVETNPELSVILNGLKGPTQRNSKMDIKSKECFYTLLKLLPITKSRVNFEAAIHFAANHDISSLTEEISNYLKQYYTSISEESARKSLDGAFKIFMDSEDSTTRFNVSNNFLLPSFEFCQVTSIEHFFENNIRNICDTINQPLPESIPDRDRLIESKICCYDLVSIMFAKLSLDTIVGIDSAITRNAIDNVKNGRELLHSLFLNTTGDIRKLNIVAPKVRLLHCAAFNCGVSIISTKNEEKFYEYIFGENKKKDQLLWQRIVDCNKEYNLQQTLKDSLKKRKKLINIKKSLRALRDTGQQTRNNSYVQSYNLASSSLTDDLHDHDLNDCTILPKPIVRNTESMSLWFERDDLNDHECMGSICGVLNHMITNDITSLPNESEEVALPKWLELFRHPLTFEHVNIRMLLLKVIFNMQTIFKPYAKLFLGSVMSAIICCVNKYNLNYVIMDLLVVLIDWHTVAIPSEERDRELAQKLLEIIVDKAEVNTQNVFKYNVEMIKVLVETWRTCLKAPSNFRERLKKSEKYGIQLASICLSNGLEIEPEVKSEILETSLVSLHQAKDEETALRICDILGLFLATCETENDRDVILQRIQSFLQTLQTKNENKLVKCVSIISKRYPRIVENSLHLVLSNFSRMNQFGKAQCWEIFSLALSNSSLTAEQITLELESKEFGKIFQNKILLCEKVGIQIMDKLVEILRPGKLLELASWIDLKSKNDSEFRESAYGVFIKIYKRYVEDISEDDDVRQLLDLARKELISGLLDPAENLQEKILRFWSEETQLGERCGERLLNILNVYSPTVDANFLPLLPLAMLQLASKSIDFERSMFSPLENCTYTEYTISSSWRLKNMSSVTPFFAPSLASQLNQTLFSSSIQETQTRSSDISFDMPSRNFGDDLQATQSLQFEPTFLSNVSFDVSSGEQESVFKVPKVPDPANNKTSRRIVTHSSDTYRRFEMKKNIQRSEMLRDEGRRQRSSVKLYRKYRTGDFPDIEIKNSSLLKPLEKLIKQDQLICKDFTVLLICSLLETMSAAKNSDEYSKKVFDGLRSTLNHCQSNSSVAATILEIMFHFHVHEFDLDTLSRVSKNCELLHLGALLLEERLIYGSEGCASPIKKCRKNDTDNSSANEWVLLAGLYESLSEADVVLSIFGKHVSSAVIREASILRTASEWKRACDQYKIAAESSTGAIMEHCVEGYYECLSHLSSWDQISDDINRKLNGNYDVIWDDTWHETWITPWIYRVHSQLVLDFKPDESFVKALDSWLKDKIKLARIKKSFGEEVAIFMVDDNPMIARDFLESNLDDVREQWMRLLPLASNQRVRKLRKLQSIKNVHASLQISKLMEDLSCVSELLEYWKRNVPSSQDDPLLWDSTVAYRLYFAECLREKLENPVENRELVDALNNTCLQQRLNVIETALNQRNVHIAKKHIDEVNIQELSEDIKKQFKLVKAKYKYSFADLVEDKSKKAKLLLSSWELSCNLLKDSFCEPAVKVTAMQHLSKLSSTLITLCQKDEEFCGNINESSVIKTTLAEQSSDSGNVVDGLKTYELFNLKLCCGIATSKERADCYFRLSKHCYDRLVNEESNIQLSREFVRSTLKAMSYESREATQYFPCLLNSEYLDDSETKIIFQTGVEAVETWLFLAWQAQLLSYLGTPIACLIIPIVKRIAETYPNAIIFSFRVTIESNPILLRDPEVKGIQSILSRSLDVENFLEAMHYLVQPELYLVYCFNEMEKDLARDKNAAVESLLKKCYPADRGSKTAPIRSAIHCRIKCTEIEDIKRKTGDELVKHLLLLKGKINGEKDRLMNKPIGPKLTKLKNYSSWLYAYSGGEIEVPGQYSGDRRPLPKYHAKIMKFESSVKIMDSKQRPMKITIIGNDAKNYDFLVKFGEDLRLDQRIEQIFTIMNGILQGDAICRQRQLFIDTYQVIPLSNHLGLIQWVNDTKSLQEFIYFTLDNAKRTEYKNLQKEYFDWICNAAPRANCKQYECYKEATVKYSAQKVALKMSVLRSKTKWDSLRQTFLKLSTSPESFLALRHNFITTYATMCIAHWILGIGDRHLSNTLVSVKSGRCLGIDFGLAFGTGVDLHIPELTPFRLTPQILGLLQPYSEMDLLGTTMIHVLRAIRNGKGPLIACLDVFVNEPLNWVERVNKLSKEYQQEITDLKWLPKEQMRSRMVIQKLNGAKPSFITVEQLNKCHNDKYFPRYKEIVEGTEEGQKRIRASMGNECLSPEEQVACLLDQAIDPNILGRTYVGWTPWL
ncbi:DNA-dependent protein kinase catalytic subunit [Orussus abietinus]|uniref:DNA-dependent protein kinase catalytic subunit n=1 Tax=Orussus abietinus TaxID=222816 RepID=UPI0006265271|nr:DNA-dependent protein kinase catalytic subunit [Orussus abietinus]XP_012276666.1 DNA-dependent protein kinase catalytic subunit [Orussus abietinus]